ncbi:MAG: hypothetical protein IPL37_14120 [Austwickia sp.]|nr:hypothetical protein [Austwickia sp.]
MQSINARLDQKYGCTKGVRDSGQVPSRTFWSAVTARAYSRPRGRSG